MTCSICPGSALIAPSSAPGTMTRSMSSPIMRVSIFQIFGNDFVQVDYLRRQHLLTAEGKQLARKRRGALCSAGNFLSGTAKLRVGSHTFEQKFRITGNHHQQVVKVVRDTACEASDGFHLLRLTQLLFEGAALGDVLGKFTWCRPWDLYGAADIRAARVVPSLRTHSATRPLNSLRVRN